MRTWSNGKDCRARKATGRRNGGKDTIAQIRRHRYGDTDTMAKIHSDTDTVAKKRRQRYGSSEKSIAAVPDDRRGHDARCKSVMKYVSGVRIL